MKFIIPKFAASLFLILSVGYSYAQDCDPFYMVEKGAVREMASYDKKNKLTGTTIQTVKDVKTIGNRTEWTIGAVSRDEKGKEISSGDLRMSCENRIFKMDMRNFIDDETMKSFEGMEVTLDATDLDYPSDLAVGQALKDGQISIKVASGGMTVMNMTIKVYDRKVVALEDMTTPAGTFSCYKLTSTIETKNVFSMVGKSVDWIAKNVGPVRSENLDKDGKLLAYMVLTSIK